MPELPPPAPEPILKASDLRGILRYVPMFQGQTFILALDGSVLTHENLPNLLTDIAVLDSLQIRPVIVFGIGQLLRDLATARGLTLSDPYGIGPTDDETLALATTAAAEAGHLLQSGLTQTALRCAQTNAIRATERGIIEGRNFLHTGKVEKLDDALLLRLIENDILPLVSPIAFSRHGKPLRLNSDSTAVDLAIGLQASKLVFLTRFPGLVRDGQLQRHFSADELERYLRDNLHGLDPSLASKARESLRALKNGVPRTHIIDGTLFGGLLTEIFEKQGVGTLFHANAYEQIRPARRRDVQAIYNMTRLGASTDALRRRTRASIERDLDRFYVFEIDGTIMACASLTYYEPESTVELGTVYVHPAYQGRGAGRKIVEFAIARSRDIGATRLIALSTQSYTFFKDTGAFQAGSLDDLPLSRREAYEREKRGGVILVRSLLSPPDHPPP